MEKNSIMSGTEWEQVGTVEVLQLRIYPIDAMCMCDNPLRTMVAVEAGTYPVYRKADAFMWVFRGRLNERMEKIGDGLFSMHNGDNPNGPEISFPSRIYGPEQLAELIADPVCQPGAARRLVFSEDILTAVPA